MTTTFNNDIDSGAISEMPKSLYTLMVEKLKALPTCDLRAAFSPEFPEADILANILRLKREGIIEEITVENTITPDDLYFEGERHYKKKF